MSTIWESQPQLVEELKECWDSGLSANQIARRLGNGITRCSVIGKVHRLNLPLRKINSVRQQPTYKRSARPLPPPKPTPPPDEPVPIGIIAGFPDKDRHTCRFIHGDTRLGKWRLCGHVGYPWCEYHSAILTVKPISASFHK